MEKPRMFWFHYNKPESKKQGRNVLTVHYRGKCHLVHDITCLVPTSTRHRNTQPHCVITGRGVVNVVDSVATISR